MFFKKKHKKRHSPGKSKKNANEIFDERNILD